MIANEFTFTLGQRGTCWPVVAGDFGGPAIGAAGTPHFEPDGVFLSS